MGNLLCGFLLQGRHLLLMVKINMTIPCTELNGLLLMCELVPSIVDGLKPIYVFNGIHFWKDSIIIFDLVYFTTPMPDMNDTSATRVTRMQH